MSTRHSQHRNYIYAFHIHQDNLFLIWTILKLKKKTPHNYHIKFSRLISLLQIFFNIFT